MFSAFPRALRATTSLWPLLPAALLLAPVAQAHAEVQPATQAQPASDTTQEIIVTGTREKGRTKYESLTPVDVISAKAVQDGASAELADNLAQVIPSLQVLKLPSSDGLQFIRPARLRGLSSDQTLVLVNGKRFHRSAFLGQRGAQGADLNKISSLSVGRVEVLRDGASAQYGSDAIAGVINIQLDERPGVSAYVQGSQYYEGDGETVRAGLKAGTRFDKGFLTASVEWADAKMTSRSHQRADALAYQAANPGVVLPNPVQHWGAPDTKSYNLALNGAYNLGFAEAYGFATAAKGEGINDINWRIPVGGAFTITPAFPGWDLKSVYPLGFTPREQAKYQDYQAVGGVRHTGEVFTWDLSASLGENETKFYLYNSINASLGPSSPFNFFLGTQTQREVTLNADGVYRLDLGLSEPVNIAFGAEHRKETYKVGAGDKASYAVGPGAKNGLAVGANGFPGFSDLQAGEWSQDSNAAYVDVEARLTPEWTLGGAVRYEDFDSFGSTTNGKVSTRYEFTPYFAARGSWSTGFRAPTPGQINSLAVSQGLDTVTLQLFTTGRLSPLNPIAVSKGAKPLQPEESTNKSAGFVWRTDFGLSGSFDMYQIEVSNRLGQSSQITLTQAEKDALVAQGYPSAASFTSVYWYTNDYNTRTKGIDVVTTYVRSLWDGRLNLTLAYNNNKTLITGGTLNANPTTKRVFEEGLPQNNATFTGTFRKGAFEYQVRARHYGGWTDSTGNSTGDIFQRFGAMNFVDASVQWDMTDKLSLKVSAENLFDAYPEKAIFQASRGIEYSRNAPYDTYGGQYYVRLNARF
ncbi:TonB-dependent receptor (plasmid) [Asticcacaulis sp. DW145]|uniref:TonB-dependent receptor plug domain-containing protein n=1 Tax=Asticcacaulis sp. DW145 TaxID=3095608 RepID=UPI00308F037B|nr:TonB-dependent receptor [Asticcacaulis sp. DW145]